MVPSLVLPSDTILNGRYRLLEPLGEGGMAIVYRGIDQRLGRTVAIKVLEAQFARDQPFLSRFQQEAEFAASLGAHPNIVDIYDIGQDGDLHYIVMELVEGSSLKELIQQRAPFAVGEAFAIGQQVASALHFAHQRGLVHRDVKPQNILVTPEGVAKVTDFGIARSASASQLTRTGMVIGTVHYFSPEQAQGQPATPLSDIYSLGIILYEMLTGHLPFDAETPIGVAMQHLHSEPPSPWEYNPELPARAVATVLRTLEKDPEKRYRDAGEFAGALAAQAGPESGATTLFNPISPPPPRQPTAVYQAIPPGSPPPLPPGGRVVETPDPEPEPEVRTVRVVSSPWRSVWLALGAFLLACVIAFAAFFATNQFLGAGSTSTSTPTATATATPKPKKRTPTPTATVAVAVLPTSTSAPLPTFTSTPFPPTPTPTPRPRRPTPTPRPLPPTATPTPPPPTPTPTPPPATPTPPPTLPPTLALPTSTAVG